MTSPFYSPLVFHVLEQVTLDRLSKAVDGLANTTYSITLTTRTEAELAGFVKNGDAVEYSVVITRDRAFCSCKDSMFRHTLCKHTVALALHALRTPVEQPQTPLIHLQWSHGVILCGEPQPQKLLPWPWPETILNHPRQWPEVHLCPTCIEERNHPGRSILKAAA